MSNFSRVMKSILVTGGAGFIGSNFIHYILKTTGDFKLVNLDALTYAGVPANLAGVESDPRYNFVHGDIRDSHLVNSLFAEWDFDTVVHFAAESHVDRSILGPAAFIETNIQGTFVLLEAARNQWRDQPEKIRFHHVSTDEVFGSLSANAPAFSETTPYDPRSPYSASKASSDHLVRAYAHTFDLPVTISNCSNNYGPRQYPEKLIPVIITNCLEGKPIPVYGDGRQIRDWLYVEDHCQAIHLILERGAPGETYNIGGDNQPTNLALIEMICQHLDRKLPNSPHNPHQNLIEFVKDRPGHDRRYAMDIRKIQDQLGWTPSTDLATGIGLTVDWYLNNLDWVEVIRGMNIYADWVQKNYGQR